MGSLSSLTKTFTIFDLKIGAVKGLVLSERVLSFKQVSRNCSWPSPHHRCRCLNKCCNICGEIAAWTKGGIVSVMWNPVHFLLHLLLNISHWLWTCDEQWHAGWLDGKLLFNACDNQSYYAVLKCEKWVFGATFTGLGRWLNLVEHNLYTQQHVPVIICG